METYAIWKCHEVIGYIELTHEQKEKLNSMDLGLYIGFDEITNPEKYSEQQINL
jgi:hypothetical protein